jgi:hypothetical protein
MTGFQLKKICGNDQHSVAIFGLSANPPTGDEVTFECDYLAHVVDYSSSTSIARDIEESSGILLIPKPSTKVRHSRKSLSFKHDTFKVSLHNFPCLV